MLPRTTAKRPPKAPPLIDKKALAIQTNTGRMHHPEERFRHMGHRQNVKAMPCMVCGRVGNIAFAHIRKGTDGIAGDEPSDIFGVPLCDGVFTGFSFIGCHNIQHKQGEVTFWSRYGGLERAIEVALSLAVQSPFPAVAKAATNYQTHGNWSGAQ